MSNIYKPETARDNPGTITRYRPGRELGIDGYWVSTQATAEVFFYGSLPEVQEKAARRLHIIDPLWVPVKEER